jgi:hypothetical protein
MRFTFEGPVVAPADASAMPRDARNLKADYVGFAQLSNGRGKFESITCTAKAPGGDVAAVGGSVISQRRGAASRGPSMTFGGNDKQKMSDRVAVQGAESRGVGEREFGSRVHLVDLAQEREITVFQTQEVGRKAREQRGSSQVLDCLFVHSWRYLAAVTGDVLSLWDTERGINLAEILLPFGTDEASLEVLRAGEAYFLRVKGKDDGQLAVYRIAPGKN